MFFTLNSNEKTYGLLLYYNKMKKNQVLKYPLFRRFVSLLQMENAVYFSRKGANTVERNVLL